MGGYFLEDYVSVHSVDVSENHRRQILAIVTLGVEISTKDHEISLPVITCTRANHNRSNTKSVSFFDARVAHSVSDTAVNEWLTNCSLQGES